MKKYKERFLLKITLSLGKTVGDALIFNFCLPPSRASLFFTGSIVILQIGHIKKKQIHQLGFKRCCCRYAVMHHQELKIEHIRNQSEMPLQERKGGSGTYA
jgi:hypothetical protein